MSQNDVRECFCPECPNHKWNPWTPEALTFEEGIERHNEMMHDGEPFAEIRASSGGG